jgi:hypothetical protein
VIRTGYGICFLAVGTWLCILVRHFGILKCLAGLSALATILVLAYLIGSFIDYVVLGND